MAAGLVANLLIPAIPLTTEAATKAAEDLIISEYIEGSSYNKAIELYNGTGSDVDLSQYTLDHYSKVVQQEMQAKVKPALLLL